MGLQSIESCERKKIEKLLSFKLPSYCKKIGWALFIGGFTTLILLKFIDGEFQFLKDLLKRLLLVSLFIVVLSKEKVEDERIQHIRAKAFSLTFLMTAMYILLQPIANLIVDTVLGKQTDAFDELGDFTILWFMLVVYLVCYSFIKKK